MPYDNARLCQVLNDKSQTLDLARGFLAQVEAKMKSQGDPDFASGYRQAAEGLLHSNVEFIWKHSESPIERIFIASVMIDFIRCDDALALVIVPPMEDAEKNMRELTESIKNMVEATRTLEARGSDVSISALLQRLDAATANGQVPRSERWIQTHMLICYHFLDLTSSIHLTPQARLPGAGPGGRDVRADLMFWVPDYPAYRLIVECDGYQYHSSKESFEGDRKRSRSLQSLGFKVLQYSGTEICRDPIEMSVDLHRHLIEEFEKRGGKLHPPESQGPAQ